MDNPDVIVVGTGAPGLTAALAAQTDGARVLIARADDVFYAYVAACPACASGMEHATLDGAAIECDSCNARFDIRRAGAGQHPSA